MTDLARRAVLVLVELALPEDLAPELVGDLAEEQARHGLGWLVRQAAGAVVHVRAGRLRRRRALAALTAGALAAALVVAGGHAAFDLVLSLVPRRAGHPPGPGWLVAMASGAGLAAAAVSLAVSPPPRRPRP
ncbi:MAG: hypothetical protein U0229_00265 [Anaeromyxobacter sp.]